jgi:hypothetical protein
MMINCCGLGDLIPRRVPWSPELQARMSLLTERVGDNWRAISLLSATVALSACTITTQAPIPPTATSPTVTPPLDEHLPENSYKGRKLKVRHRYRTQRGLSMSDTEGSNDERPCLHCLIADTINNFYAEYETLSGEKDAIDVDEVISALGKIVADLISGSDFSFHQTIIKDLMSEISRFEAEYASEPGSSDMRH